VSAPADVGHADTGATERETWSERRAYLTIAAIAWIARRLPTATGRLVFRWGGSAAYLVGRRTREVVAANQAKVLGRAPDDPLVLASTKAAFRGYARYWFDLFHVAGWLPERVDRAFTFDGYENLRAALEGGKGAIVALPHMGNWDVAGPAMAFRGERIVAVAERLRPARLFRLFSRVRAELAIEVVGLDDAGVGRRLATALGEGAVVALIADRELGSGGIEVEMFGATRRLPAGPAMLHLRTEAPIVPGSITQTRDGWRCVLETPLEVTLTGDRRRDATAITTLLAERFERAISGAPSDWFVFQPAWDG